MAGSVLSALSLLAIGVLAAPDRCPDSKPVTPKRDLHIPAFPCSAGKAPARTLRDSQPVRFVAVGLFNTLFGYVAFAALQATLSNVAHYLILLLIAHVISVLVAFLGYRVIVFRVRGQVLKDLLRFWSVYASALAVNIVALPFLVEVLDFPVLPAQGLFTVVTAALSFIAHRRFSFRRPITEADG